MKGNKDCPACRGSGYATVVYQSNLVRLIPVDPEDPTGELKRSTSLRFVNVKCLLENGESLTNAALQVPYAA